MSYDEDIALLIKELEGKLSPQMKEVFGIITDYAEAGCKHPEEAKEIYWDYYKLLKRIHDKTIKELLAEEDPWISCKEKMPEDEVWVMVFCENGYMCEDLVDKDTGDFYDHPAFPPKPYLGTNATHWRPALKGPREQNTQGYKGPA